MHTLRALIEIGVDMTRFQVQKETPEATNRWQKTWSLLIKDIKNENKVFEFFWSKGDLAQRLWEKKEKELPDELKVIHESILKNKQLHQMVESENTSKQRYKCETKKEKLEKEKLELESEMAMMKSFGFDSKHLERVYRSLLGEKMKYRMGDLGPHLDLFLLSVLMNQRELAFELWKQCEVPVCVAICAVRLLLYVRTQACTHIISAHAQTRICALAINSLFTPLSSGCSLRFSGPWQKSISLKILWSTTS